MPRKGSPGPTGISREAIRLLKGQLTRSSFTQLDISRMTGISQSQLSRILSFEKELTVDQCDQLCVALDLPITDLFDLAVEVALTHKTEEFELHEFLVAEDPLGAVERQKLRNEELKKAYDQIPLATVTKIGKIRNDDADIEALIDQINAGEVPIAAQKRTEPLDENYT